MAHVDFTLDDIRIVVREEVDKAFDSKFEQKFDSAFKKAFVPAFKETFPSAFEEAFEPYALAIQQDFARVNERLDAHDVRFDKLEADLQSVASNVNEIRVELKGVKRIIGQHSKEIIELRSHLT
jgi:septal ring factor EnvC (AmiA/AmiB activator)